MTVGEELHRMVAELYPICRSITGDGVRRTLEVVGRELDLEVREVPSGTQVLDWTVPREWNVREAWVAGPDGRRVIDFADSNLHLMSYSAPVSATMPLEELRQHLYTLPEHPDWIPYRTSYYAERWGFCASQRLVDSLPEGDYQVRVDTTLANGHLTYAEHLVPGRAEEEVLVSCHICHPSLANDNLSGIAVATRLARMLGRSRPRYSYRFLFIPGTIGSITWLARNEDRVGRIRHGLVLACVGDPGGFTYKRSRRGDAEIDRVVAQVLGRSGRPYRLVDFTPLRLRRAAVLLARLQPAGRLPEPHPLCRLPRVPHLGRRPRPGPARAAGGEPGAVLGGGAGAGGEPPLPEPQPQGRAAAGQAGVVRLDRRPQ